MKFLVIEHIVHLLEGQQYFVVRSWNLFLDVAQGNL